MTISSVLDSPLNDTNTPAPPRTRSLSPSHSNSRPISLLVPSSTQPLVVAPHPSLSPASSILFNRNAPVVPSSSVPSSPSFSRPTSPSGRDRNNSTASGISAASGVRAASPSGGAGPTLGLGHHILHSHSGSGLGHGHRSVSPELLEGGGGGGADMTHIFERDVEFQASHHLSPNEAVDIAIPPVLDEVAVALSTTDELSTTEFASIVEAGPGSGWSSPVVVLQGRGGSSVGSVSRGSSPPGFGSGSPNPLSQSFSSTSDVFSNPPTTTTATSPSSATSSLSKASPLPLHVPTPSSSLDVHAASSPDSSPPTHAVKSCSTPRRLSFTSYADIVNEERREELIGAPIGESLHSVSGSSIGMGGTASRNWEALDGLVVGGGPGELEKV